MAFSDEQITNLRAKLQLPDTADEAAIVAAVNAVVEESLEERTSPAAPPAGQQTPPAPPAPEAQAPSAAPETPALPVAAGPGTLVIDQSAWDAMQDRTRRLEAADAKRRREERDEVIVQAIRAGKFAPARREHWVAVWDKDPEGTRTLIDGLTPNVVPVQAMGELGDSEDSYDEEFSHLFPPTPKEA